MLRREEARELLAYDAWANGRMARMIERAAVLDLKIARTWAHTAAAAELWYARSAGDDYARIAVWPEGDARAASQRLQAANERWCELAGSWTDEDLAREVSFENSRGEACTDALCDIVRHLVNHGTHHRGQIAMLLRASGTEPENLDFIIYCRERAARKKS